jgi:hypothetical protein
MNLVEKFKYKITRRDFVKETALRGAAGLAIGAGGIALQTSCNPEQSIPDKSGKTIREPARDIRVCREADVVVVGGGPGGIGAAIAAARSGADTVLIERYGHLGGMGTGGLVTILPNMSDINGEQQIAGICQEWVDRLDARQAADYPKKEHWGSTDEKLLSYYRNRSMFYTSGNRVGYSVHIDAEISKCILNDMVKEAGVKTYLHSWGTMPIMEGNKVKGVIFESKSGRQAVLAKVVIDSTGDGDLLPYAGAEFNSDIDPKLRMANLSFSFYVANVDLKKYQDFAASHPEELAEQRQELEKLGGHFSFITSNLKDQDGEVWCYFRYPNSSQVDVEELTRVEFEGRKEMLVTQDYRRKHTPGFENSYIALTNPQLGTRGSRRVVGDYVLTEKDTQPDSPFEDTIATFPNGNRDETLAAKYPHMYIPYRSLIPSKIDNLLVACRAFSANAVVNNSFNLIPHCIAFGQAAGTAAAIAANSGAGCRGVDCRALQDSLSKQGVPLPSMAGT